MDRFLFPPWVNKFTTMVLGGAALGGAYIAGMAVFGTWPTVMNPGYSPAQPVPFSHRLHAGQMKMDCRYCHNTVDKAAFAAVPSTNVCTNCHSGATAPAGGTVTTAIHTTSIKLTPVRQSEATGRPVEWEKIHDLADFVYFSHAAHVNRGVSCVECHGRIDTMDQVHQDKPLTMSWCLECHRAPVQRLRPQSEITNLAWTSPWSPEEHAKKMQEEYGDIHASTSCSTCHR